MAIPPDPQPGTTLLPGFRSRYGHRLGEISDADLLAAVRERKGIGADVSDDSLAARLERAAVVPDPPSDSSPEQKALGRVREVMAETKVATAESDPSFLERLRTYATTVPRGLLDASARIVGGLDTVQPILPADSENFDPETRARLGELRSAQREQLDRAQAGETIPSRIAASMRESAGNYYAHPAVEGDIIDETGTALSGAGLYLTAGLASGVASPLVMGAMGVTGKGGSLLDDAKADGLDADERERALNYRFAGAAEALPFERVLNRLVPSPLRRRFVDVALGALEEASQEAFDQVTQNIALGRDLTDGVGESAAAGGRVGAILNALTTYLGGRGVRRRGSQAVEGEADPQGDAFPTEPIPGQEAAPPQTPDPLAEPAPEAAPVPDDAQGGDAGAEAGAEAPVADEAVPGEAGPPDDGGDVEGAVGEAELDAPVEAPDASQDASPPAAPVDTPAETGAPVEGAQEGLPPVEGETELDYFRRVASESTDPDEIVSAYLFAGDTDGVADPATDAIASYFEGGGRVATSSFDEFGDRNTRRAGADRTVALNYLDPQGRALDTLAEEISLDTGLEVTASDVAEFIRDNPTGTGPFRSSLLSPEKQALASRFQELTGEALTPESAKSRFDRVTQESQVFRQRHADINERRERHGHTPLSPARAESFAAAERRAEAPRVNPDGTAGPSLVDDAGSIAALVLDTDHNPTETEAAALFKAEERLDSEVQARLTQINTLIDGGIDTPTARAQLADAQVKYQAALDELELIGRANHAAGSKAGIALARRKQKIGREPYSLINVRRQYRARKGANVTPEENARLQKLVKEKQDAEDRAAQLEQLADAAQQQASADTALKVAKRTARSKTKKEAIEAERTEAKAKLRELGMRVNSFTGLDPQALFQVGRLAKTYVQEGAESLKGRELLDDTVAKVRADLPALTEADVWAALNATDPKAKRKAESAAKKELKRRAREAQTQARILRDIDTILDGATVEGRPRAFTTEEVKRLQKILRKLKLAATTDVRNAEKLARVMEKIEAAQLALDNGYRAVKERRSNEEPAELTEARQALRDVRNEMRAEDRLATYKDDLRTGNLAPYMQAQARRQVPEAVERARTLAYTARKKIDRAVRDAEPTEGVFENYVRPTADFLRTAKATADVSYAGRQGAMLGVRGLVNKVPKSVAELIGEGRLSKEAFANSIDALVSDEAAHDFMRRAEEHPNFWKWQRAGLFLADLDSNALNASARERGSEELYRSDVAENLPGVGRVVRASERNMAIGLNALRISAFEGFMQRHPDATIEEQKAWAHWVNAASGRGSLNDFAMAGKALSLVMFSPRFTVSRVEAPYLLWKYRKMPAVRTEIAKDLGAFYGTATATLGLAAFAIGVFFDDEDVSITLDPMSSDFGKLVVANTRVDLFAGGLQPIRFAARAAFGDRDVDLMDQFYTTFARYKAAPAVSIINELRSGKTVVGEERPPLETIARSFAPLIFEEAFDAYNAYANAGVDPMTAAGAAGISMAGSAIGLGFSTYDNPLKSAGVQDVLKDADYSPNPSDTVREGGTEAVFEQALARLIRENRDDLDRIADDPRREALRTGLAEVGREDDFKDRDPLRRVLGNLRAAADREAKAAARQQAASQ